MLKQQNTRIMKSLHREVATGFDVKQEGVALVYTMESGKAKVRPSAGTPGERFAGVSLSQTQVPDQLARVDVLFANGGLTLALPKKNLVSGQVHVVAAGVSLDLVASGPAAGEFAIDYADGVITLNAANAGTAGAPINVEVFYRYIPTIQEATLIQGSGPIGGYSGAQYTGVVGLITEGDVFTDMFDASDDWAAGGQVYLGSNGLFTLKNAGVPLHGCNILEAPTSGTNNAFLGLNFGPYSG